MSDLRVPFAFEPAGKRPPRAGSFSPRQWCVRHSRGMERAWAALERLLHAGSGVLQRIKPGPFERAVTAVERGVKGALFDCRMCGQCVLSSTGMSCPMNCPKSLRNGPCGGVRADGRCEVQPEMDCVWVKGWEGSRAMKGGDAILTPQPAIDHRLKGRSSWLAVARDERGAA